MPGRVLQLPMAYSFQGQPILVPHYAGRTRTVRRHGLDMSGGRKARCLLKETPPHASQFYRLAKIPRTQRPVRSNSETPHAGQGFRVHPYSAGK